MRLFVVVFLFHVATTVSAKSVKKIKDDSTIFQKKLIGKAKPLPPAIIAIEIVDPHENKTSKNSKRTIGSSLGYGYQSPPKYQVYKYSQHDIPPYRGPSNVLSGEVKTHHYDIQKSVSYNLPSQVHKSQSLSQYYQPGTTLFSTINSQGQVGSLSSHLPQQSYEPQVPVIILRVFPSQLTDPSAVLHPNLPQNHPLASTVNSIDIQSLLAKYVQNLLIEQNYQQPQYQYQQPDYQQYQYVQQPQYYSHTQPGDGLLTHENYPRETHTRVIFRTDKNKVGGHARTETKTIQIALPSHAYSAVQVETPSMQYSYASQGDDQSQYYQQGEDVSQNYYYQPVAETGYHQIEQQQQQQQQQQYEQPEQQSPNDTPHGYHAHQKRSKKNWFSRSRLQEESPKDVIKLEPIRA